MLSMKYVRTLITLAVYLVRLMREVPRADVLHIFTPGYLAFYLAPLPALIAARLFGKPAILNYHDGRAEEHCKRWPIARRLMRLATSIVVPSQYLLEVFARFGLKANLIQNIVETNTWQFRERSRPQPIFLHNRGLATEYNPACTLRAFAKIQECYPEARLTIAHDGPLRGELEALAAALNLRHIQFTGPYPKIKWLGSTMKPTST
jgi:glycosyltransferase involved in cell wall biosynthesis